MYEYNLALRFERIVKERGKQTALWFDHANTYTYDELNNCANRIARLLAGSGVRINDIVCISGTKTVFTYAAIIACLKLGAGYTMLDPDSPSERLRKIVAQCRPRCVIAEGKLLAGLKQSGLGLECAEIESERLFGLLEPLDGANVPGAAGVTGNQVAYVMFTSGSTGFPKGATMTHANVLNLIAWARATYAIDEQDVLTNVNPLYFDNSVFDLYSSLFSGARLVPFTKDETRDPKKIVNKVNGAGCTLWFSVPSLLIFLQTMKAADGKRLRSVRRFVFGGEGYPKAKLKQLYDAYKASATLHNVYGPTECTCICSSYLLGEADFNDINGLPPLGTIAPNFGYLILGDTDVPVPEGEIGELCLMGPNVGRGYYNDSERSAKAFVQNPLNTRFAEIMYRTGDLARFNPADGKLYIHGRKDNQIKHMGYRIELEELDAGMHCLSYVNEAASLHATVGGLSRILAVVSLRTQVSDEALCADLRKIVPHYMIPAVIHRMDTLPKNANGKVDRKRLYEMFTANASPQEAAS